MTTQVRRLAARKDASSTTRILAQAVTGLKVPISGSPYPDALLLQSLVWHEEQARDLPQL